MGKKYLVFFDESNNTLLNSNFEKIVYVNNTYFNNYVEITKEEVTIVVLKYDIRIYDYGDHFRIYVWQPLLTLLNELRPL